MKKILFLFVLIVFTYPNLLSQNTLQHIEPPFWWCGMKSDKLQLMLHGENIGSYSVGVNDNRVSVSGTHSTNPNYLFIDLVIASDAQPGTIKFELTNPKTKTKIPFNYELKTRRENSAERQGFNSSDNIYLIMPDRFANGNPQNDNMSNMLEKANRSGASGRHGGDLKGIRDHLDYLKGLGITALWCTPVLENNMPHASYHGYAITDLYKTDPRFGTNEEYKDLISEMHGKGLKMIMDMVFNHFGSNHWWMKDLPASNWLHQFPEFTNSNYRNSVRNDPYVSDFDVKKMNDGWFAPSMPDFDQTNSDVATYLTQNSIWWIEYADLDGIRMDTYPYSDVPFMCEWMKRIHLEYPNFNVVGEVWLNSPPQVAYWQEGSANNNNFHSNLNTVFDFPMCFALQKAFTESEGWSEGMGRLYDILSQDFLYKSPMDIVTFLDNHDIDRATGLLKTKENMMMALAFLATTRGYPLVYYGTEILMPGMKTPHGDGDIRRDMPGGWSGDSVNVFTNKNLTADQREMKDYTTKVLNWRKTSKAVQLGKLKHFIPENGIYVYFRYTPNETVMVLMNNNSEPKKVDTQRFDEVLKNFASAKNVIDGMVLHNLNSVNVPAKTALIFELGK